MKVLLLTVIIAALSVVRGTVIVDEHQATLQLQ